MWFLLTLIMIFCIEFFYRQHTRRCDWKMFEGRKEFFDEVRRKGDKLGRRIMYERKQQMCEKHLKVPPSWILGTMKRELNLCEHTGTLDDLHNEHDKALA
jgi:hypothetical protein